MRRTRQVRQSTPAVAAFAIGAAVLPGCLLPGLDDLAGSSVADASVKVDGGSPDSSRPDAAPDVNPPSFCATNGSGALLCDDFESGTFAGAWGIVQKFSTIKVAPTSALGGSKLGLLMQHDARTTGGDGFAALTFTAPTPPSGVEMSLRVRLEVANAGQEIAIVWANGSHSPVCYFYSAGTACFINGSDKVVAMTYAEIGAGEEHRWVFRMSSTSVQVLLDGSVLGASSVGIDFGPTFDALVGPEHISQGETWKVSSDDVLIRAR